MLHFFHKHRPSLTVDAFAVAITFDMSTTTADCLIYSVYDALYPKPCSTSARINSSDGKDLSSSLPSRHTSKTLY